jgi:hypothetical protein
VGAGHQRTGRKEKHSRHNAQCLRHE